MRSWNTAAEAGRGQSAMQAPRLLFRFPLLALPRSRRNGYLQHTIPLVGEQIISVFDAIERKVMGDQQPGIDTARLHRFHQPAHSFLAARAQGGADRIVAKTVGKGI